MRIAISGLSGCGNTTASRLVAQKLGLKVFNYTFRDIGREKGLTLEEVHEKAEKADEMDLLLDQTLASYATEHDGIVIAARLPIWLDDEKLLKKLALSKKPSFDLKVWLYAPIDVRAARIAKREGKPLAQTLDETRARDEANAKRYKRLYGIDMEKHSFAFVIDSSKQTAEKTADLIVKQAMKTKVS